MNSQKILTFYKHVECWAQKEIDNRACWEGYTCCNCEWVEEVAMKREAKMKKIKFWYRVEPR